MHAGVSYVVFAGMYVGQADASRSGLGLVDSAVSLGSRASRRPRGKKKSPVGAFRSRGAGVVKHSSRQEMGGGGKSCGSNSFCRFLVGHRPAA